MLTRCLSSEPRLLLLSNHTWDSGTLFGLTLINCGHGEQLYLLHVGQDDAAEGISRWPNLDVPKNMYGFALTLFTVRVSGAGAAAGAAPAPKIFTRSRNGTKCLWTRRMWTLLPRRCLVSLTLGTAALSSGA